MQADTQPPPPRKTPRDKHGKTKRSDIKRTGNIEASSDPPQTSTVLAVEQRRRKAVEMAMAHETVREIAEKLGVGSTTIHNDLMQVLARTVDTTNAHWYTQRELSVQQYDSVLKTLHAGVMLGELESIDRWLAVKKQRDKLLGLDLFARMASAKEGDRDSTERDQSIVRQLAHPNERLKGLLAEAIKTPGSTLLRVINELVKAVPIETTAESAE